MYAYLTNIDKINNKAKTNLDELLIRHHIKGQDFNFSKTKEILPLLREIFKNPINSLVIIGTEFNFETVISHAQLFPKNLAVGFIPLETSNLAETFFGIKNTQEAIEILVQRKIVEQTIFSLGKYFFFQTIEFQPIESTEATYPLHVEINPKLKLQLPFCYIRFNNNSFDQYRQNNPIQLEVLKDKIKQKTSSTLFFKSIFSRFGHLDNNKRLAKEKIGQIYGQNFSVSAATPLKDNLGRVFKQSLDIGKYKKTIRLIVKRKTQPG